MRSALIILVGLPLLLAGVTPAAADVTIKASSSGKAMGYDADGITTTYIKGGLMRSDVEVRGKSLSTILDVDKKQMIIINHQKKLAEVFDLGQTAPSMKELDSGTHVEMKATGKSRSVVGLNCDEYAMKVSVATQPVEGETVNVVVSGPVCLSGSAPGVADYRAFYTAVAEKGLFFGDPRSAKAQPGQAHGMTELYHKMASAGIGLATDLAISFEGSGMMASIMERMGKLAFGSEVRSISTDSLPASTFEIPAGYKTKTK
jgi:Domain of unknown function (DUF4412)